MKKRLDSGHGGQGGPLLSKQVISVDHSLCKYIINIAFTVKLSPSKQKHPY